MHINSIQSNYQSNYQPNFKATVSKDFIDAAKNYLKKNPTKLEAFEKKVDTYKYYGTDDINIFYKKNIINGKANYALYAAKNGMKPEEYVVLTVKDFFRKVVEKFMHINKYEFDMKTMDIQ